jgi:endonuclease YncB( thermonuclease family)
MRRQYRQAFWPIILLISAVGYLARDRSGSTTIPNPTAPRPAPTVADEPVSGTTRPPIQISESRAQTDQPKATTADHREKNQLRLRVVGVYDGDTLTGIDEDRGQHKIRLDAIDAPELGQPFGQASKKALAEKVFGKYVVVIAKTKDRYGRTVGHVLSDGRDINLEMLDEGMAWHYTDYDRNKRLAAAEQAARAEKRGLWQDRGAVRPSEWRRLPKESRLNATQSQ